MVNAQRIAVIVPTLNAGGLWRTWLEALAQQTCTLQRKLVIDSSSTDDTVKLAAEYGLETMVIERKDFNHGGTRQMAAEYLDDCDFLVFLTQDAILATPDALTNMLAYFDDPDVAICYGRQLPHHDAGPIGAHARLFNYPAESRVRSRNDIPQLGIKATFCSDSFACYRRSALLEAGGFKRDLIFGEDAHIAARLVLAGKKVAYAADAAVYHSHDYSLIQDFKRYFDVGVFHTREAAIFSQFGSASGEGMRFVKSELRYMWQHSPILLLSVVVRTFIKYAAYKIGKYEQKLPNSLKMNLSMNSRYWRDDNR